jgi:hypothetical protein
MLLRIQASASWSPTAGPEYVHTYRKPRTQG